MIPLKQIVLDCIADKRQRGLYDREADITLSREELLSYVEGQGYPINPTELFNVADAINILNTPARFKMKVVEPLQRQQGIYF